MSVESGVRLPRVCLDMTSLLSSETPPLGQGNKLPCGARCCTRVTCLKHGYKITREELGKLPTYYLSYQIHTSQRQLHTSYVYTSNVGKRREVRYILVVHVKFGENLDGASRSFHHSSGLPRNTMAVAAQGKHKARM